MKILKQNTKAMQVEFTFEEYFRIANWLKHKPAGKIEIESRDALENFISMSSFINPKIAVCVNFQSF